MKDKMYRCFGKEYKGLRKLEELQKEIDFEHIDPTKKERLQGMMKMNIDKLETNSNNSNKYYSSFQDNFENINKNKFKTINPVVKNFITKNAIYHKKMENLYSEMLKDNRNLEIKSGNNFSERLSTDRKNNYQQNQTQAQPLPQIPEYYDKNINSNQIYQSQPISYSPQNDSFRERFKENVPKLNILSEQRGIKPIGGDRYEVNLPSGFSTNRQLSNMPMLPINDFISKELQVNPKDKFDKIFNNKEDSPPNLTFGIQKSKKKLNFFRSQNYVIPVPKSTNFFESVNYD